MSFQCYPGFFGAGNPWAHPAAPYNPVVDKGVNLMGMGVFPWQQQGECREHPPGLHEAVPGAKAAIPTQGWPGARSGTQRTCPACSGDTSRGRHA